MPPLSKQSKTLWTVILAGGLALIVASLLPGCKPSKECQEATDKAQAALLAGSPDYQALSLKALQVCTGVTTPTTTTTTQPVAPPEARPTCSPNPCPADRPVCTLVDVPGAREKVETALAVQCSEKPEPPQPPEAPQAQPYLDDSKLTLVETDKAIRYFPTLNAAVLAYKEHEPTHWNGDRLAVSVATGYARLSAWLRPTVAAQSTASGGWVSGEIFVCDGGRCEAYLVFAGDGKWNNTTGSWKGAYSFGGGTTTPPAPDPLAKLAPLPERGKLQIVGHPQGKIPDPVTGEPRELTDFTIRVFDAALCKAYGFTDGRQRCALGPDGDPKRLGRERWAMGDLSGSTAEPDAKNPFAVCVATPEKARAWPNPANWSQCISDGWTKTVQLCSADHKLCGPVPPVGY